jgi:hypothetical protein
MRTLIAGGIYGEALASGEFAVTVGASVRTHAGLFTGPFVPLYTRVTKVGGFKFAGQRAEGEPAGTVWWDGDWHLDSRVPNGESGCIWDQSGVLQVIEPGPHVTSQGYRYVAPDGRLVRGDETVGLLHGMNQRTDLSNAQDGSLIIGQGNPGGGVRVWDGSQLRELESGVCTFIRANREGDTVAIAYRKPEGCVLHWLTVADLRALPVVTHNPVVVPPNPVIDPPVVTPPEPIVSIPNQKALVTEIRNAVYPDMIGKPLNSIVKAFQVTKRVAWNLRGLGVGVVAAKQGSENNAEGYTSDIVALSDGTHWDIFEDGEGKAFPDWRQVPAEFNGPIVDRWRAAFDPGVIIGNDPGDEDEPIDPKPVPVCDCKADLAALRASIAEALLIAKSAAIQADMALEIARMPDPEPVLPELVARGKVSLGFLGSRNVELPVVKK